MLALAAGCTARMHAGERVLLTNGFTVECLRHESAGDRTRLYLPGAPTADAGYMDVAAAAIVAISTTPDVMVTTADPAAKNSLPAERAHVLSATEMHPLLAHAGEAHRVDEDLLASVVRAESGGHSDAVSRTGARGLMQLMPATATSLGVADAFQPAQNVDGGAAYLDQLLLRYHDDVALALAAYNAGPGAVDRYHGVPPYRETRAYVTRVIREFNQRKLATLSASSRAPQIH